MTENKKFGTDLPGDAAFREYWEKSEGLGKPAAHHAFAAGWNARRLYDEDLRARAEQAAAEVRRERPFSLGDRVRVLRGVHENHIGEVVEIRGRSVYVRFGLGWREAVPYDLTELTRAPKNPPFSIGDRVRVKPGPLAAWGGCTGTLRSVYKGGGWVRLDGETRGLVSFRWELLEAEETKE